MSTQPATDRALGKGLEGLGPGRMVTFRTIDGFDLAAIVIGTVKQQREPAIQNRFVEIPDELQLDADEPGRVHLCVLDYRLPQEGPAVVRTHVPFAGDDPDTIVPETWRWPQRM